MQETPETLRSAIATDVQKHLLGVIRRRSNNVGASALWVDTPAGAVLPLNGENYMVAFYEGSTKSRTRSNIVYYS